MEARVTEYIQRLGRNVRPDEAFYASTSGDLKRMVRALSVKTNPIDRHFLLQGVVEATYKLREDSRMRQLCIDVGLKHLKEFPRISPSLALDFDGRLPTVPSFKWLATALAEAGRVDDAIAVCNEAHRLGLHDGTMGGYSARAERLSKKRRCD